jgi:hypothetical protein
MVFVQKKDNFISFNTLEKQKGRLKVIVDMLNVET